jgi:diguanylate cyclase (GGDEF)-like protein
MQSLGRVYTIAMLDIDFFKKFNDRYGHDVGDQVLRMVASHIKRVGGGGKSFRYGGEEFTIIFPGKAKQDVLPHLDSLRESIAGARFWLRGTNRPKKRPEKRIRGKDTRTVSVTISIGTAEPGRNLARPSAVLKEADRALYRAKKKGRNCVV